MSRPTNAHKKVVVIGGGTGSSTLLRGLKPAVGDGLTAIVNMVDDGGSTRILRDEYGALPPGDLRQCLVALSNHPKKWREMFNFRFGEGRINPESGLKGHTLGNLLITAAEEFTASQSSFKNEESSIEAAVQFVGELLNITGHVLPVTTANRRLVLTTPNGQQIIGEHNVEKLTLPSLKGAEIAFDQTPTPLADMARQAIIESDVTVIAPGDLYTSIAPTLAVNGMAEALGSAAKVVLMVNVMNRNQHTQGFTVQDYAAEVERIVGANVLDYVIYNRQQPTHAALQRYAQKGYEMVRLDAAMLPPSYQLIGGSFVSTIVPSVDPNDALADSRSLVRHDSHKVAEIIMSLIRP